MADPEAECLAVLRTRRLFLRQLAERDAPFIVAVLNEPGFIANIADKGVRTEEQARDYLRTGPLASYATHGFGLWWLGLPDGTPVGLCGLLRRPGMDDVEIGYALLARYEGQGYATEAASACLTYGRARYDLARIVGIVNPDNVASARVLEKIGLRYEGRRIVSPEIPEVALYG